MITLSPIDLKAIVAAAEAGYPEEICGLLVGRWTTDDRCSVREVVPSDNVASEKAKSFEIDPALRFNLQRSLRGGDENIVGLYHSHPDHSAQPSARDLELAWEPDLVWLVTSVLAGEAVLTSAHTIERAGERQRFCEIPLHTSDWTPDHDRPVIMALASTRSMAATEEPDELWQR